MNTTSIPIVNGFTTTRRGRRISIAGATYVGAWVTGLVLAPATPAAVAAATTVHAYYVENGAAILLQSSLIHGVAGLALAVMALTLPPATRTKGSLATLVRATGVAAAMVSFIQVALAVVAVATASSTSAPTSDSLFDALNYADTVKLMLLAVFAGGATAAATRADMLRRWMHPLTFVLVVALPVGGMAFVVNNAILTAVLYASLPLLLIWAGATAWQVGRRAF